jgi:hypothetical protein
MAKSSWLIPYFALEEEGKPLYDQADIYYEKSSLRHEVVDLTSPPSFSFNIFIDGTMRLYNVGLARPYTPLFLAVVSAATLRREGRKLFNTNISSSLYLLLFPFQTYREYLQEAQIEVSYADIENFINQISRWFNARGLQSFKEDDLDYGRIGGREIFKHKNCLVICDISKRGVVQKGNYLISREDLFNPQKIKEAAKARVRRIMELLEFRCLLEASDNFSDYYILKDGLIDRYNRVKHIFGIDKQTYQAMLMNVVGFIKYPRKIPPEVRVNILSLSESQYYRWIGRPEDDEDDENNPYPSPDTNELFDFALLRFRRLPHFLDTPVGIVKLQTLKTEHNKDNLKEIVQAVLREKYPLPSDHRRIYSEPFPIEEAEKVAKAQLPSEDRVRGLVYSLM